MSILDEQAPWLPKIYVGRPTAPAKRAYQISLGKMLQPAPSGSDDRMVPYLRAANVQWDRIDLTDYAMMWASQSEIDELKLVRGDLLVCEGGEVGRAARIKVPLPEDCIIQNALHRVRGTHLGDVGFLEYLLSCATGAGWFDVLCNRATIAHFTVEKFREFRIPLPTIEDQKLIADYLDRETAEIDQLIKEKDRMLTLLEEKRSALISHLVTRGVNARATLTPSGFPWLGEIPKHWRTERSKRLLIERDERSVTGTEEMLTVSHLTGVTKRSEKDVNMFEADSNEGYKLCSPDNLAINTLWAWMGAMGVSKDEGIVSPAYHVYRIAEALIPAYVDALVRTPAFVAEITRFSKGVWSSRLRLYPEGLYEVWLPVPPREEQKAIVEAIRRERETSGVLEAALRDSIVLLKERRAALITAAVTGQIPLNRMTP